LSKVALWKEAEEVLIPAVAMCRETFGPVHEYTVIASIRLCLASFHARGMHAATGILERLTNDVRSDKDAAPRWEAALLDVSAEIAELSGDLEGAHALLRTLIDRPEATDERDRPR